MIKKKKEKVKQTMQFKNDIAAEFGTFFDQCSMSTSVVKLKGLKRKQHYSYLNQT